MKRLRRFLEIIAACGLATVAAYWLAMSDVGPGAELVTHTKASTSPAETALQTSPNREANSYSRPSNVEQLPSYEPAPKFILRIRCSPKTSQTKPSPVPRQSFYKQFPLYGYSLSRSVSHTRLRLADTV